MAKRFTSTEKWNKSWHRQLPPEGKLFWDYICGRCDAAGVWDPDFELASFQIGLPISEHTMSLMGDRVERLSSGKWWIVGFCRFQYVNLSPDCRGQAHVWKALHHHNLVDRVLDTLSNRVLDTHKDKDKDKEPISSPDKGGNNGSDGFDDFWSAYPRKVGKLAASKSWRKLKPPLPKVLETLAWQAKNAEWIKEGGKFIPHPATWLNRGGWNDEPTKIGESSATQW